VTATQIHAAVTCYNKYNQPKPSCLPEGIMQLCTTGFWLLICQKYWTKNV